MEEADHRQMALAVQVVHQTRAAVEEVVHRTKVTVEEVAAAAEERLPKKLERLVPASVSWVAAVAVDWWMDGIVPAKEAVEADQRLEVVQLDFWEEAEGVRQR